MNDYLHPEWQAVFHHQNLDDFESIWDLDIPLLDTPNTSRGGISSVARLTLTGPDERQRTVIVKRQQNHNSRTLRHPLHGLPTTQKEFINIRRFERLGLETVTPVFFAGRQERHKVRAVLITAYLENYQSFEEYLERCAAAPVPDFRAKRQALRWTANWVRRMHQAGIQHSSLYTKHLFISTHPSEVPVRGIDLEKARRQLSAGKRLTHDLSSLFRRTTYLTRTDQLRFLLFYHGPGGPLRKPAMSWHRLQRSIARKQS